MKTKISDRVNKREKEGGGGGGERRGLNTIVLSSTPSVMSIFFSVSAIASVESGLPAIYRGKFRVKATVHIKRNWKIAFKTTGKNHIKEKDDQIPSKNGVFLEDFSRKNQEYTKNNLHDGGDRRHSKGFRKLAKEQSLPSTGFRKRLILEYRSNHTIKNYYRQQAR